MSAYVLDMYIAMVVQISDVVDTVLEMFDTTSNAHVFTYLFGGRIVHCSNVLW